jgi:hypothetical protein
VVWTPDGRIYLCHNKTSFGISTAFRETEMIFRTTDYDKPINVGMANVLTEHCAGSHIEKNEIGRTCGAYWGGKRGAQGVGEET